MNNKKYNSFDECQFEWDPKYAEILFNELEKAYKETEMKPRSKYELVNL